jgi:hypothetical protein
MSQTTIESRSEDEAFDDEALPSFDVAVSSLPEKESHEDDLRRFIDELSTPFVRLYEDAYISNELRTRLLTIVPADLNLGFVPRNLTEDDSIVLTIDMIFDNLIMHGSFTFEEDSDLQNCHNNQEILPAPINIRKVNGEFANRSVDASVRFKFYYVSVIFFKNNHSYFVKKKYFLPMILLFWL